MPKKAKVALAKEAQTQVKKRTEELLDDDVIDEEGNDFDESSVIAKVGSTDHKMAMRRRLENYLEERRLMKELGEDFDYQ